MKFLRSIFLMLFIGLLMVSTVVSMQVLDETEESKVSLSEDEDQCDSEDEDRFKGEDQTPTSERLERLQFYLAELTNLLRIRGGESSLSERIWYQDQCSIDKRLRELSEGLADAAKAFSHVQRLVGEPGGEAEECDQRSIYERLELVEGALKQLKTTSSCDRFSTRLALLSIGVLGLLCTLKICLNDDSL